MISSKKLLGILCLFEELSTEEKRALLNVLGSLQDSEDNAVPPSSCPEADQQ